MQNQGEIPLKPTEIVKDCKTKTLESTKALNLMKFEQFNNFGPNFYLVRFS